MPSMKNILESLPAAKRQRLALFYEKDDYKLLKEVLDLLRLNQAKNCLQVQSLEDLKFQQGQAHGLKMLHLNIKELHKKQSKKIDKD